MVDKKVLIFSFVLLIFSISLIPFTFSATDYLSCAVGEICINLYPGSTIELTYNSVCKTITNTHATNKYFIPPTTRGTDYSTFLSKHPTAITIVNCPVDNTPDTTTTTTTTTPTDTSGSNYDAAYAAWLASQTTTTDTTPSTVNIPAGTGSIQTYDEELPMAEEAPILAADTTTPTVTVTSSTPTSSPTISSSSSTTTVTQTTSPTTVPTTGTSTTTSTSTATSVASTTGTDVLQVGGTNYVITCAGLSCIGDEPTPVVEDSGGSSGGSVSLPLMRDSIK